ncbi:hypothetical protein FRC01_006865 [Tulasnella sp. 417]|nr:hypothetical protein FRC01_006865 [Tulasnella sp. 417]
MSNNQEKSPDEFIVPAPFDSSSPGDCILQSIEGAKFKVLRQILGLASPVMADMFNMPQGEAKEEPRQEKSDQLPVVLLEEDTETVHNLLILLYPTSVPIGLGVQAALKLAKAYDKYLIPKDRLQLSIGVLYSSRVALEANPVEFYKLAWELDMETEAKTASRFTHRVPLSELCSTLPIQPLEKLLDMRARREEGLDSLVALLEPKSNICEHHGAKDVEFFRQLAALKAKARTLTNAAFSVREDKLHLF